MMPVIKSTPTKQQSINNKNHQLNEIKENNHENQNELNSSSVIQNSQMKNDYLDLKRESSQAKQTDYYQEFCRLYLANAVLETHLRELSIEKSQLINKLHKLEKKAQQNQDGNSNSNTDRKKRVRRSAADIARHYKCLHQNCSKSYGSQGSLNQHIKLKHPDLFRTLNIPDSMLLRSFGDVSMSESQQL